MPLFEYKCDDCGKKFEEFRTSSNDEPAICPGCQSTNTTKLFSTFASSGGGTETLVNSGSSCGPGSFT